MTLSDREREGKGERKKDRKIERKKEKGRKEEGSEKERIKKKERNTSTHLEKETRGKKPRFPSLLGMPHTHSR